MSDTTTTLSLDDLAADARSRAAACASPAELEALKVELFGKKGTVTAQLKSLGALAPDVLCLQEVSVGFGELAPAAEADQVTALAALFPGYEPVFVPAIDRPGVSARRRFGNLILSRLPVLEVVAHDRRHDPWMIAGYAFVLALGVACARWAWSRRARAR